MGNRIHTSKYEETMDLFEQIVNEEPDFETEYEQAFIDELLASSLQGFTDRQAKRIQKLHAKYVLQEREIVHDDDE